MTLNDLCVSLLLYQAISVLSFTAEASRLSAETPSLYCPEKITYRYQLDDILKYYQPNPLHPMIQRLLQGKNIRVEAQFPGGSQYVHSSTQLVTDSKRFLTGLVCHYRNKVDYSKATLRFSFMSGFPFGITGLHSGHLPSNKIFCLKSWNAITATEECSKQVVVVPEFHLISNQLNRNLAHSVLLVLASINQPKKMNAGIFYTVPVSSRFSIYIGTGIEARAQEVCNFHSPRGEALQHPTLVEVREKRTITGHYTVYCQRVSNTHSPHKNKPKMHWQFEWGSSFFNDFHFFDMPDRPMFNQWFDDSFNPYQSFHQRNNFHQQGYYQSEDKKQPYYLKGDPLAKAYRTLGLSPNTPKKEVKKRYRKLAMQYHPDKGGDREKFQDYADAYEVVAQSWK